MKSKEFNLFTVEQNQVHVCSGVFPKIEFALLHSVFVKGLFIFSLGLLWIGDNYPGHLFHINFDKQNEDEKMKVRFDFLYFKIFKHKWDEWRNSKKEEKKC